MKVNATSSHRNTLAARPAGVAPKRTIAATVNAAVMISTIG